MINLADPRIGSKIIYKTDDFFAAAHRILNIEAPVFKDGLFDKHGKWIYWFDNGRLEKEEKFSNGVQTDGKHYDYFDN